MKKEQNLVIQQIRLLLIVDFAIHIFYELDKLAGRSEEKKMENKMEREYTSIIKKKGYFEDRKRFLS